MADSVQIHVTARDTGDRIAKKAPVAWKKVTELEQPSVVVYPRVKYQTIAGFGGAFTEATTTTIDKLPKKSQEEIYNAYFHPKQGHGYTLCRSHINSCDFALGNYAYVEQAGDTELKTFSLERDKRSLMPAIKRASKVAGREIDLFASPWSPPAWMKDNGMMNHGGKLMKEFHAAWAKYYVKFINEYEKAGIPIWGLTVQNEPAAVQRWDSCIYTAADERDFVRDHLGPALKKAKMSDRKLMIWDHNRDLLFERAQICLDDKDAAQYIWGVGFHWYVWDCFDNVQAVHDAWPDKHLIFTEGCQEGGPHVGAWAPAERYARSVINDLNRWTEGWVDWNLVLDINGGPNHVNNFCQAPILADTKSGKVNYQASYFYLGHFSRFIKPGAKRIMSTKAHDDLEVMAAQNPDKSIAVVVMNRSEHPISFTLKHGDKGAPITIPRRGIVTLTF